MALAADFLKGYDTKVGSKTANAIVHVLRQAYARKIRTKTLDIHDRY